MNEIEIENTVEQTEPAFNWHETKLEDWETPEAELEAEPEYKHLVELCSELGLQL